VDQPPVQRVCPHCARISYDSGRRCPYCGRGFRRSVVVRIAALLTLFALVVLGGVYVMLVAFGNELDDQLDREVQRVERELDRNFDGIQRDVREELDRRLPEPTATP
jgi:predicted PurR-regulated permease PerM